MHTIINSLKFCFFIHSTDIAMKECAAYGGVTAHSGMEDVYENPHWIDMIVN